MAYGDLPGIVLAAKTNRAELLRSYVIAHLEEEIRREKERPRREDARHVVSFLAEQRNATRFGYVVYRAARPELLHERVLAIPWFCL